MSSVGTSNSETPFIASTECPSVGSLEHTSGKCRPCAFFHTKTCNNGPECTFCHVCPPEELQRRRRVRRNIVGQEQRASQRDQRIKGFQKAGHVRQGSGASLASCSTYSGFDNMSMPSYPGSASSSPTSSQHNLFEFFHAGEAFSKSQPSSPVLLPVAPCLTKLQLPPSTVLLPHAGIPCPPAGWLLESTVPKVSGSASRDSVPAPFCAQTHCMMGMVPISTVTADVQSKQHSADLGIYSAQVMQQIAIDPAAIPDGGEMSPMTLLGF